MKIKRYTDEQIRKKYKYWISVMLLCIFFLVLSGAAILISEPVVSFMLLLAALPIFMLLLFSNLEANYNMLLLEIRKKEK